MDCPYPLQEIDECPKEDADTRLIALNVEIRGQFVDAEGFDPLVGLSIQESYIRTEEHIVPLALKRAWLRLDIDGGQLDTRNALGKADHDNTEHHSQKIEQTNEFASSSGFDVSGSGTASPLPTNQTMTNISAKAGGSFGKQNQTVAKESIEYSRQESIRRVRFQTNHWAIYEPDNHDLNNEYLSVDQPLVRVRRDSNESIVGFWVTIGSSQLDVNVKYDEARRIKDNKPVKIRRDGKKATVLDALRKKELEARALAESEDTEYVLSRRVLVLKYGSDSCSE